MCGVRIIGTGSAVPKRLVSNEDLKEYVDTSDEWIRTRTGIETRYFSENEKNYQIAEEAAQKALQAAGVGAGEIAVCIVATVSGDYATPSVACMLQKDLRLQEDIPAFDINAACSGFLYGLNIASRFLTKEHPYALVVGSEQLSRLLDMEDRSTCVLFGDGAGAAVIKLDETAVFYSKLGAQGDNEALVCGGVNTENPHIRMQGQTIFRFAVKTIDENLEDVLVQTGKTLDKIDYVVCHQANKRIISHVVKKKKADPEQFYMNMNRYGNTSAASIPIALDELVREGKVKFGSGQKVICLGFGGGLTYASAYLEF